jgi:hypothetical protein
VSRAPSSIQRATAAASGGEAIPVLEPAISTPAASAPADGAAATVARPTAATTPADTATRRGPQRAVAMMLSPMARQ